MKTTEIYKGINAKMENRIDNSNLKYLSRSTKLGKKTKQAKHSSVH